MLSIRIDPCSDCFLKFFRNWNINKFTCTHKVDTPPNLVCNRMHFDNHLDSPHRPLCWPYPFPFGQYFREFRNDVTPYHVPNRTPKSLAFEFALCCLRHIKCIKFKFNFSTHYEFTERKKERHTNSNPTHLDIPARLLKFKLK